MYVPLPEDGSIASFLNVVLLRNLDNGQNPEKEDYLINSAVEDHILETQQIRDTTVFGTVTGCMDHILNETMAAF
jgi:hypothetical protein